MRDRVGRQGAAASVSQWAVVTCLRPRNHAGVAQSCPVASAPLETGEPIMKTLKLCLAAAILLPMSLAARAAEEGTLDLRRGVPADVYMAVYGKHNSERDFQRQHFEEVWKTIKETKILEKALQIVTSRMPQTDVEQAQAVLKEVQQAAAVIDVQALLKCQELIYAQLMEVGTAKQNQPLVSQHLFLLRLTPESATQTQEGIASSCAW